MQANTVGFDVAMFKFHEKWFCLQVKRGGILPEKNKVIDYPYLFLTELSNPLFNSFP
jgi:hypothetical protein